MDERIWKSDKNLYENARLIEITSLVMIAFGIVAVVGLLIAGAACIANGGGARGVGQVLLYCSPSGLLITLGGFLYRTLAMAKVWTAYDIKLIRNAQCNYAESEWLEKL